MNTKKGKTIQKLSNYKLTKLKQAKIYEYLFEIKF